jgi:hypothetical protein
MKKKKDLPPIIFIFKGDFPDYAYDSLKINSYNTDNKIILLCDFNKIDKSKINNKINVYDIKYFSFNLTNLKLEEEIKNFRKNFWLKTIERFFILHKFVKYNNIEKFYHVELDNILANISDLHFKLNKFHNKFFFPTYKNLGFGSFVYVNNLNILKIFCNFSLNKLKKKFYNDMELLGLFAKNYPAKVLRLPTIDNLNNKKNNMNLLQNITGLFDEARIGVYLFGNDPKNYCNVLINRRKYLTDKISFAYLKKFTFEIKKKKFILLINNKKIKIYNLHIHSKLIKKIFINKKYQKILNRSNNDLDTLIDFNFKNIFKLFFFNFRFSRFFTLIRRGL